MSSFSLYLYLSLSLHALRRFDYRPSNLLTSLSLSHLSSLSPSVFSSLTPSPGRQLRAHRRQLRLRADSGRQLLQRPHHRPPHGTFLLSCPCLCSLVLLF